MTPGTSALLPQCISCATAHIPYLTLSSVVSPVPEYHNIFCANTKPDSKSGNIVPYNSFCLLVCNIECLIRKNLFLLMWLVVSFRYKQSSTRKRATQNACIILNPAYSPKYIITLYIDYLFHHPDE